MDKVTKTDEEWRAQLDDLTYKVTRKHATERAFSNEDFPKGPGVFTCTCCGAALFDTDHKFDSGSGWPSFYQPKDGTDGDMVGEQSDNSWFMKRTEVHCNTCEAHLGHVFNDGPQPTGLRYCINGVSLGFEAKDT